MALANGPNVHQAAESGLSMRMETLWEYQPDGQPG